MLIVSIDTEIQKYLIKLTTPTDYELTNAESILNLYQKRLTSKQYKLIDPVIQSKTDESDHSEYSETEESSMSDDLDYIPVDTFRESRMKYNIWEDLSRRKYNKSTKYPIKLNYTHKGSVSSNEEPIANTIIIDGAYIFHKCIVIARRQINEMFKNDRINVLPINKFAGILDMILRSYLILKSYLLFLKITPKTTLIYVDTPSEIYCYDNVYSVIDPTSNEIIYIGEAMRRAYCEYILMMKHSKHNNFIDRSFEPIMKSYFAAKSIPKFNFKREFASDYNPEKYMIHSYRYSLLIGAIQSQLSPADYKIIYYGFRSMISRLKHLKFIVTSDGRFGFNIISDFTKSRTIFISDRRVYHRNLLHYDFNNLYYHMKDPSVNSLHHCKYKIVSSRQFNLNFIYNYCVTIHGPIIDVNSYIFLILFDDVNKLYKNSKAKFPLDSLIRFRNKFLNKEYLFSSVRTITQKFNIHN